MSAFIEINEIASKANLEAQLDCKPLISQNDLNLLNDWIPKNGRILEFGCGESTRYLLENGARHVSSVEADVKRLKNLYCDSTMVSYVRDGRLNIEYADIGPVGDSGYPLGSPSTHWMNYHSTIWERFGTAESSIRMLGLSAHNPLAPRSAQEIDLVVLNGRFRVACICQTLLNCRPSTHIFVNEFLNRPFYYQVLLFTEIVAHAGTGVILRRTENNDDKIRIMLQQHSQDPR